MAQAVSNNEDSVQYMKDFHLGHRMMDKNPECCDCNATNPKWAVISHGVFVCDECMKVHRTLIDTSRVQSTDSEAWTNPEVRSFFRLGSHKGSNEAFNKFWEYYVNSKESQHYKPVVNSTHILRGNYITAKYHTRYFHKKNNASHDYSAPLSDPNPSNSHSTHSNSISKKQNNNSNKNTHATQQPHDREDAYESKQDSFEPPISTSSVTSMSKNSKGKYDGILSIYFMNALTLPVADFGVLGIGNHKSDPYVYCYQINRQILLKYNERKKEKKRLSMDEINKMVAPFGPPNENEKESNCTHVRENKLNPRWMTKSDKLLVDQGKKPKGQARCMKFNVIEKLPVKIEIWDYDTVTNDDLMCYCDFDVFNDCYPPYTEHFITKEMTVAKQFRGQSKFKKKGEIPTVNFYATYDKSY